SRSRLMRHFAVDSPIARSSASCEYDTVPLKLTVPLAMSSSSMKSLQNVQSAATVERTHCSAGSDFRMRRSSLLGLTYSRASLAIGHLLLAAPTTTEARLYCYLRDVPLTKAEILCDDGIG